MFISVIAPFVIVAVAVAVVCLLALPALGQVVAVLAGVEAFEDRDPQGYVFFPTEKVGDSGPSTEVRSTVLEEHSFQVTK